MALQLPADTHETVVTCALPPTLRAALPGTSTALSQVPPAWATDTPTRLEANAAAIRAALPTVKRT
jgi:hypothetical protein